MKDSFWVDIEDLTRASEVKIALQCDYCKEFFYRIYHVHRRIKKDYSNVDTDTCSKTKCKRAKMEEVHMFYYGHKNVFQNEEIKEKIKETTMKNYGVENYSQSPCRNEKVIATSMKNYGVPHPLQHPDVQRKVKETNLERYGTEWALSSDVVREKITKTLSKNGTTPTSKPQLELFNSLLNLGYKVVLNYSYSRMNIDIALFFDNLKIAIEYDGWYWHKDRLKQDYARDAYLKSEGWKILRVRSGTLQPENNELLRKINYLIETKSTFREIILADWGGKQKY